MVGIDKVVVITQQKEFLWLLRILSFFYKPTLLPQGYVLHGATTTGSFHSQISLLMSAARRRHWGRRQASGSMSVRDGKAMYESVTSWTTSRSSRFWIKRWFRWQSAAALVLSAAPAPSKLVETSNRRVSHISDKTPLFQRMGRGFVEASIVSLWIFHACYGIRWWAVEG